MASRAGAELANQPRIALTPKSMAGALLGVADVAQIVAFLYCEKPLGDHGNQRGLQVTLLSTKM